MTLYGLVDVLRGPGLAFSRLVAPFTLKDGLLELVDTRAFSPSLGLTAKGQVDLDADTANLRGTIVPAYFFNSLLGNVPLVGRLFSPERGGGLFAASFRLHGDLDDPDVSVNPLAALDSRLPARAVRSVLAPSSIGLPDEIAAGLDNVPGASGAFTAPGYSASSQSRSGRHNTPSAVWPAAMPIWPAAGSCSTAPGISAGERTASDSRGTMRSRAGAATKVGSRNAAGSTGSPATRHSPRAGVLAPYQPARHSRATGAASGTPSFSQSSSATNSRAALAGLIQAAEAAIFGRRRPKGRAAANNTCNRSTGMVSVERQHRLQQWQHRGQPASPAPGRAAWKSQGAASSASARTRSGRRCAAATASVPPMQ